MQNYYFKQITMEKYELILFLQEPVSKGKNSFIKLEVKQNHLEVYLKVICKAMYCTLKYVEALYVYVYIYNDIALVVVLLRIINTSLLFSQLQS